MMLRPKISQWKELLRGLRHVQNLPVDVVTIIEKNKNLLNEQ